MGRLILIRHGESEGNRARCFTPHPDVPLTDVGRAQARTAAATIAARFAPRAVVSSPFLRARQTAEILAGSFRVPLEVEADLRERHMGEFAGRPYAAPRPGFDPEAWWAWRPPGGETLVEVADRAGSALDRLAAAHTGADLVVVSHGGVMLALARHVSGAWGAGRVTRNAGLLVVEHARGAWGTLEAVDAPALLETRSERVA